MKRLLLFLLAPLAAQAVSNTLNIYEIDGANQTGRPTTFGRVFAQGEISLCAQPVVGGTPIGAGLWQDDVKTRWPDGSLQYAIISFVAGTFTGNGVITPSFQNAACNNAGYLTQSQMVSFNGGNWGGQILVAANGVTITRDAKVMLGQTDPGTRAQIGSALWSDCGNTYWLQGPVVTSVVVQDCTSSTSNDFGWKWNGTNMLGPGGVAGDGTVYDCQVINCLTASPNYASLHPMFTLTFYPTILKVKVDVTIEDIWRTRIQDQMYDLTIKTGSPLAAVYSYTGSRIITGGTSTNNSTAISAAGASFTLADVGTPILIWRTSGTQGVYPSTICSVVDSSNARLCSAQVGFVLPAGSYTFALGLHAGLTRKHKSFWSGTPPGAIRIDHNFPYLASTKMVPNYDQAVKVSATQTGGGLTGYGDFVNSDMGDGIGVALTDSDWGGNTEGANIQRWDLQYLYNMNAATSFDGKGCGNANSHCALGYAMVSGVIGAIDTQLANGPQQPTTFGTPQAGLGYRLSGGGGMWYVSGAFPYHLRESLTAASGNQAGSNFWYCPNYATLGALNSQLACGATVGDSSAFGRPLSRHAHSTGGQSGTGTSATVGTLVNPPNGLSLDIPSGHWIDDTYVGYLLTGDYYLFEEELFAGSFMPFQGNNAGDSWGRIPISTNGPRYFAWPVQTLGRAAAIAPDASSLKSYYVASLTKSFQAMEGLYGLTTTAITPPSPNTNCSSFNNASTDAWSFGHCVDYARCLLSPCSPIVNTLHVPVAGQCPVNPAYGTVASIVPGNPTTVNLTQVGTAAMNGGSTFSIWGIGGTGWADATVASALGTISTGINGVWNVSLVTSTKVTIPVNTTGFGAADLTQSHWVGQVNGDNTDGTGQVIFPPNSSSAMQDWQAYQQAVGTAHVAEIFPSIAGGSATQALLRPVEQMTDTGYNPALSIAYISSVKQNTGLCTGGGPSKDPGYTSWAQSKASFTVPFQAMANNPPVGAFPGSGFLGAAGTGNFACADHNHGVLLRAALAYAKGFGIVSTESGCPGGTPQCTADAAWNFVAVNGYTGGGGGGAIPYFSNPAGIAAGCGTQLGSQIKFALTPRVSVTPPSGTTYYVDPAGSDANPGTSSLPFLTLPKAIGAAVNPGDVAIFRNGSYPATCATTATSWATITASGTSANPIIFKAENRLGVTFDSQLSCAYYIVLSNASQHIIIDGVQVVGGFTGAINNQGGHNRIQRSEIHHNGNYADTSTSGGHVGILNFGNDDTVMDSLLFHDNGRTNTQCGALPCTPRDQNIYAQGTNVVISNSLFYNLGLGWAIAGKIDSGHTYINNTVYGPAGAGRRGQIVLGDDTGAAFSNITIRNNIFSNALVSGIVLCGVSLGGSNFFDHNIFNGAGMTGAYDNGSTQCNASTGTASITEANESTANPLFINVAGFNFHIPSSSPAVNAGVSSALASSDYDGISRSGGNDIGAYEANGLGGGTKLVGVQAIGVKVN